MRYGSIQAQTRFDHWGKFLVVKPEIQALVALVLGGLDIVFSLCRRPSIPLPVSPGIHVSVEKVDSEIEEDVVNADRDQIFVATAIARSVVCSDPLGLHSSCMRLQREDCTDLCDKCSNR